MISKPYLHKNDIQSALLALSKGASLKDHPLSYFLGVQTLIKTPHALPGDTAVDVAIRQYLATAIVEHLSDIRALYEIPAPDVACTDLHLSADFQQDNDELQAWSVLYHRYVCVDRALSNQGIATLTNVPERTINRRHGLGITRLTMALIEWEQTLRRENTYRRLLLALPRYRLPDLIGIESSLETGYHILTEAELPHHLVLHGPAGIGKTDLALVLAHHLIDHTVLSDLLWVKVPDLNITQLTEEITTRLGIPIQDDTSLTASLRAYLLIHPTLIVLDSAESLIENTVLCETIFDMLDSAIVVITSRLLPDTHLGSYILTLPELKREQAFEYLDSIARRVGRQDRTNDYDAVWNLAGGNPLMLETLLGASMNLPLDEVLRETTGIFNQIWTQLNAVERKLWLLPLLCFQDGIPYEWVAELSGLKHYDVNRGIDALVNHALFYPEHVAGTVYYTVQTAARIFMLEHLGDLWIDVQLSARHFLQAAFERYLPNIEVAAHGVYLLNLSLDFDFPPIDCYHYAQNIMPIIMQEGLWPAWAEILTRLQAIRLPDERQVWVTQMLGIAQRWLGQFDKARQYLEQSLAYYDMIQDDLNRANCLIELSVVNRYQMRWDEAQQFANSALAIYRQQQAYEELERAVQELAQLALEQHRPAHAINWLDELSQWSARAWGIAGQAYLQLEQHQQALDATQRAVDLQPLMHPNRGRAMGTLGQIQHALEQADLAATTLSTAMRLLDESKDIVGYARVCNNLAVAFFDQSPSLRQFTENEIRDRLLQAVEIQTHIGDGIGLAVTRQNISYLFPSYRD